MKQVNDMKHVQGTTAIALLFDGKPAGRIIANWSDNPAGSVCSASVIIWDGPLKDCGFDYSTIGRASGYGYDKLSQAVWQCFKQLKVETIAVQPANGRTNDEFLERGYQVFTIC
jgi:hypothetical protein